VIDRVEHPTPHRIMFAVLPPRPRQVVVHFVLASGLSILVSNAVVRAQDQPVTATPTSSRISPDFRGSTFLAVNGTRLHVDVQGHGPPILFLHAGISDSHMWDEQVRRFRRHFTVIRFDARGYGLSLKATAPFVPADDCEAVLAALGVASATIIGSSFGGTVALDLAVAHPSRVARLVIVSGSPGWQSYSETLNQRTTAILVAGQEKGPDALTSAWMNDPMLTIANHDRRLRPVVAAGIRRNAEGILAGSLMRPPEIAAPRLDAIKIPTLLIVGDQDDPEVVQRTHEMRGRLQRSQEIVIRGADHLPNMEFPGQFNEAMDRFLTTKSR
jgi:pimeloyl-ACP methyl ester carboxylesterase